MAMGAWRSALVDRVEHAAIEADRSWRRWARRSVSGDGIHLHEGRDHGRAVDRLAATLARSGGTSARPGGYGRVGLDGVLGDLDRLAVPVDVPATAAEGGFRWDDEDFVDQEWWPQGITTSADASDTDDILGRRVVVVGWYAKRVKGATQGARLTFVDVTDPSAPRYRHVLLVEPVRPWWKVWSRRAAMHPVAVHAGGIVWYGPSILVADTRGGVRTFVLDDICRVPGGWRGYEYVIPQRTSYRAVNDRGFVPFKFSFVSLDRSGDEHQLIAGEYGRTGTRTRLVRFRIDAARAALALEGRAARPVELLEDQLPHMQGATVVGGTYYISTSAGKKPGSLWVRPPGGELQQYEGVLSIGPEDLTYVPQQDCFWNCSEYPGKRYVYRIPRPHLDP